jgi:DNA-binding LytR/AlgR family response regulator
MRWSRNAQRAGSSVISLVENALKHGIALVRNGGAVVAEGEWLHITTIQYERHTISYRLKDLEARLDPTKFVRLGRGTIANLELISVITQMPGGTSTATLCNGQPLAVSRLQSWILREQLLRV